MTIDVMPCQGPSIASGRTAGGRVADSVAGRISAWAVAAPAHPAVSDGASRLTYKQLDERSSRLASLLIERGAGPEVCVGLLLERSVDFLVSALAVLKSGAAYLPLDSSSPADRTATILSDAGAPLLVSHRGKSTGLPAGDWKTVELDAADKAAIDARPIRPAEEEVPAERLAYVVYTSGSTGRPKGVEITHGNLLNLIEWHQRAFGVTPADRASQVAGLGFDAAGWEIWPHLTAGASVHVADELTRRSPQAMRDWLLAERITVSFVPTVLAEQMLHFNWPADAGLRVLLTGADRLHRRPARGLPFKFVNNYGPTECTVVATSGVVSPEDTADGNEFGTPSIGRPILNTTALILDDALRPVEPGTPGELCLAGALVGRGYRNMPELTADRFVRLTDAEGRPVRVYRTGDRVRLLPDGEIAFLGRLDDQVKIRGYRIELGEIVSCLDRFPGIEASVVVASQTPEGPALVAYVTPAAGAAPSDRDVRAYLAARLPDYMVPAQFVSLPSLPLTPSGKIDKAALPPPDAGNLLPGGQHADAAPAGGATDSLESRIAAIVAGLLNQPTVAPEDNFFMIGGHSMLGVQLVARIRDTFGVKLSLRQLFGAPTATALAAEVAKLAAGAA